MNRLDITKKKFIVYLVVAFGFSWFLQIIASAFANNGNMTVFRLIMALAMYMPFLGVLIARIPLKGMGWVPYLRGKVRYIFFSLYMPLLLSIIGAVLFFAIFPNAIDWEFSTTRLQLEQAGAFEQLEAQGLTIPMYFFICLLGAVTYGPFINMFAALGEEVGWRGVMYPYLKEKLGVTKLEHEAQQQAEQVRYMEDYWKKLEQTHEIREKTLQWLDSLAGGTQMFLDEAVGTYVKAFVLSVTIFSPKHFRIHWFDDTCTEVECDSVFEGYQQPGMIRRKY